MGSSSPPSVHAIAALMPPMDPPASRSRPGETLVVRKSLSRPVPGSVASCQKIDVCSSASAPAGGLGRQYSRHYRQYSSFTPSVEFSDPDGVSIGRCGRPEPRRVS